MRLDHWSFLCNKFYSSIREIEKASDIDIRRGQIERPLAGSGSKELTLGAALIDSQGSVRGHSSLSRHPSGIYYPS